MEVKLIGEVKPFEIDVKRFYLECEKIEWKCTKCNTENVLNLSHDYLSYPTANEQMNIDVICEECNTDFEIKSKLNVYIELIK